MIYQHQDVRSRQPADGSRAVDSVGNNALGTDDEAGCVNKSVLGMKEGPCQITKLIGIHAVPERKAEALLCDHRTGILDVIYGTGDDPDLLLFEIIEMGLKIGQLPMAERSKDTAIDDKDGPLSSQIIG